MLAAPRSTRKAAGATPEPVDSGPAAAVAERRQRRAGGTVATPTAARGAAPGVRDRAARATRDAILAAATKVFAKDGYAGAKVDRISKAAHSHDRMIYYYFGSKEGLYIAVLEAVYRRFDEAEAKLALDGLAPLAALQAVVRFVWGHYRRHPEFIGLLNAENVQRGRHIAKSPRAGGLSAPAVAVLAGVLARGTGDGSFRADANARDVYLMVAAMGYFYLSNRHTLAAFLGEKLDTPEALAHWEGFMLDAVGRAVSARPAPEATRA
jgi:TetR/AcrR family transcriptional regulator, upper aerobic nicotinate degradation pathway regulator